MRGTGIVNLSRIYRQLGLMALLLLTMPACIFAASGDRVAAVVNDQVITQAQIEARAALNIRQMQMPAAPTAEQRQSIEKRTLATMIDEELQKQFAAKAGLNPTPKEIEQSRKNAQEAMGAAGWEKLTGGVPASAVDDKLAAEIRWQKIMANEIRPRVNISTAEVDRLIEELAKSRHVLEREISMILVNATDEADEKAQLAKMNDIKDKIAKGSGFADMARAYSDDKSAVNGGKLGWFTAGELNPQLEEALDKLQPGQVSDIIRTPLGWHLIKLDNVRTTKPVSTEPVTQLELFVLAATTTSDTTAMKDTRQKMDEATRALRKPEDVRDYFTKKQYGDVFPESAALDWVAMDDLQPQLQQALKDVKVGDWSPEVQIDDDFGRVYVAGTRQSMPQALQVYRERVSANLLDNRMELAARRFMRELRQRAFVDVRL